MKVFLGSLAIVMLLTASLYGQGAAAAPAATVSAVEIGPLPADTDISPRLADTPVQLSPAEPKQEAGFSFPWMRTMGGMGLVICLMIGVYFAAKKFAPSLFSKNVSDRNLKIIETLSMGDKRSISMIEVAGNRFLIGNTAHQINLLTALAAPISLLSEPEALEDVSKSHKETAPKSPFRNLFEAEKRRPVQYASNPIPDDIRSKMRQLREALER